MKWWHCSDILSLYKQHRNKSLPSDLIISEDIYSFKVQILVQSPTSCTAPSFFSDQYVIAYQSFFCLSLPKFYPYLRFSSLLSCPSLITLSSITIIPHFPKCFTAKNLPSKRERNQQLTSQDTIFKKKIKKRKLKKKCYNIYQTPMNNSIWYAKSISLSSLILTKQLLWRECF